MRYLNCTNNIFTLSVGPFLNIYLLIYSKIDIKNFLGMQNKTKYRELSETKNIYGKSNY